MNKLIFIIDVILSLLFSAMIVMGIASMFPMKNTPTLVVGVLVVVAGVVGIIGSFSNIRNLITRSRGKSH